MNLDELINTGWSRHADHPEEVAASLEQHGDLATDPAKLGAYLGLANHTIGEHLGDWPRAERFCARIVGPQARGPELAGSLMALTLAQYMAGQWARALTSEAELLGSSGESAAVVRIKLSAQVANALIAAKNYDQGVPLYRAVLELARQKGEAASHRSVAITSNNLASELLELGARTPEQADLMLLAAGAALEFWGLCGTWVNTERALYLMALVRNAIGDPEQARTCAEEALALIAEKGEEKVDEAFLRLALAEALGRQGRQAACDAQLQKADALAAEFPSAGLKSWYEGTRKKTLHGVSGRGEPAVPA